jgi:hypothetical protein
MITDHRKAHKNAVRDAALSVPKILHFGATLRAPKQQLDSGPEPLPRSGLIQPHLW